MKHLFISFLLVFQLSSCQLGTEPTPIAAPKEVDSKTAALFSQLAYLPNAADSLSKYAPDWKIVWQPQNMHSNHAIIASNGPQFIVAIRGSLLEISWQALDNWLYQDLHITSQKKWDYVLDHNNKAYVARGAYDGWQNIKALTDKDSQQTLEEFLLSKKKIKELVITGHSLGGNLAVVTSSWLYHLFKEKEKLPAHFNVITFAAPAMGTKEFAKDFTAKFPDAQRIYNPKDLVTRFPISSQVAQLGDMFEHIPGENIRVEYRGFGVSLSTVFKTISFAINGIDMANGFAPYEHTVAGKKVEIKNSVVDSSISLQSWFKEAGFQHKMANYAEALGAPVILP